MAVSTSEALLKAIEKLSERDRRFYNGELEWLALGHLRVACTTTRKCQCSCPNQSDFKIRLPDRTYWLCFVCAMSIIREEKERHDKGKSYRRYILLKE